jgi:hypothetical protein
MEDEEDRVQYNLRQHSFYIKGLHPPSFNFGRDYQQNRNRYVNHSYHMIMTFLGTTTTTSNRSLWINARNPARTTGYSQTTHPECEYDELLHHQLFGATIQGHHDVTLP